VKHNIRAIAIIVSIFLLAQIVGLAVTSAYLVKPQLPLKIERPQVTEKQKSYTFLPIVIFILIATGLTLLLIKFAMFRVWKFWFLLSVWFCLTISFNAFVAEKIAIVLALIFALLKVYKQNVIIHNFTEVFIYGALAAIFVPILNVISAFVLLVLISIYDYIAVRRTKHMIKLAGFQSKTKLFAGLLLPYKKRIVPPQKKQVAKEVKTRIGVAILGGGDIGFPLLFAGVVMKQFGFGFLDYRTFIVPLVATLALLLLFLFGSDKRYYPAMPYLSIGCAIGYILVRFL